jgi:hypothetical protein
MRVTPSPILVALASLTHRGNHLSIHAARSSTTATVPVGFSEFTDAVASGRAFVCSHHHNREEQ